MKIFEAHITQIKQLCASNNVKALFAFGSVVNGKLKKDSDIDLIVDIDNPDPLKYADNYFALKFQLQQLLKRDIDLLEQKALTNPFLKREIDATKVLVYGK